MTKPTKGIECIDCKAERERRGLPKPKNGMRPAPYGGPRSPRCATHARQHARASKAGVRERRVQKIYGLAPGEYGKLYLHQEGVCAICRRATGATRALSVDHDHKNGLTRGLLCRPCNDLLGHLRDDPEAARRIAQYLTFPPARQLGIVAIHEDFRKEDGGRPEVPVPPVPQVGNGDQE